MFKAEQKNAAHRVTVGTQTGSDMWELVIIIDVIGKKRRVRKSSFIVTNIF